MGLILKGKMEVNRTANLKKIEASVKNKFRWNWLEEKDGDQRWTFLVRLRTPCMMYASLTFQGNGNTSYVVSR